MPAVAAAGTRVVVRERTPASITAERLVQRLGGHVGRQLPLLGGFAATVPTSRIATLRHSPAIRAVHRDAVVQPQALPAGCDPTQPDCFDALAPDTTWQTAVRLGSAPSGHRGQGVGVALIDTGVTPSTDLGTRLLARIDLTSEGDGLDHYGHGTHMTGLIAGNGTLSGGAFPGAAPEADLVSVKVAGWDGATDVSTIIAGLQWAVSNRVFNPDARLGASYFKGSGTSQAAAVVSGVAARMVDANASLTPDQVKGSLVAAANDALAGEGAGAGLLDAAGAIGRANPDKSGRGSGAPIPRANRGLTFSTGLGSIAASRGSETVVADLDGDGAPEPLDGEIDALGHPWDAVAYAANPWTLATFAATPWTARVTELTPAVTVPAEPAPLLAWEERHWGASDRVAAGWDADTWAARHWGARHWGSVSWR